MYTNKTLTEKINKIANAIDVKTATQKNKEKFNNWMRKMGNIYYSGNDKMYKAYERID